MYIIHQNKPVKFPSLKCLCESGYFSLGSTFQRVWTKLRPLQHSSLYWPCRAVSNKGRDKQSNSNLRLPSARATRTTKVLAQLVTPPKYNLVGFCGPDPDQEQELQFAICTTEGMLCHCFREDNDNLWVCVSLQEGFQLLSSKRMIIDLLLSVKSAHLLLSVGTKRLFVKKSIWRFIISFTIKLLKVRQVLFI